MCTMMPTFACVPAVSAAQRVFGLFQPARNHDSYGYLLTCYHVTCYLVIRSLATYYFVCNLLPCNLLPGNPLSCNLLLRL